MKKHVNHKMKWGFTALYFACARRDEKYIEKLLTVGGDLRIKDNNARTPLDVLEFSEIERLEISSYVLSNNQDELKLDCDSLKHSIRGVATINDNIFNYNTSILRKIKKSMIESVDITELNNVGTIGERVL